MSSSRTKRGMTLIELLVAMVIGGLLLGVAVTMLARIIATNAASGEHLEGILALDRLGEQFRRDVHDSARASVVAEEAQRISLTACDGTQVEYEIAPVGLHRKKTLPGGPPSYEAFVLRGMKALRWRASPGANGEVALEMARVTRRPDGEEITHGQFAIEAFTAADCPAQQAP